MDNPYPYSLDNKRYATLNWYGRTHYGARLVKIPLDAGFSCPNRDGTAAYGGCTFCLAGSESFPQLKPDDLYQQFRTRQELYQRKWPDALPLAYFQSYSNTYAPPDRLKQLYQPFLDDPQVRGLVIATRPDCLPKETIAYLSALTAVKPIWLELGLQSIHDATLKEMNRGHDAACFFQAVEALKDTGIKISVHLINGWPTENEEMMLQTAQAVGQLPIQAVKIHMLQVLKGTPLGERYEKQPFPLLTKEQYCRITARQITVLRPDILLERLTGDGPKEALLAPQWALKKVAVIDRIDQILAANDWWEGKNYPPASVQ